MNLVNNIKNRVYRFLRKTEKYTSTDMIYLAKGGFWLTLGQIISTTASLLLAMAFANLLDPVTYGNYKYIFSLAGILSIFTLTGMGTAITQAVAREFEGSFYSVFREKLKFGALASIAAISLAGYYFFQGNYILPIPLLITAVFLPLIQASGIYGSFLLGRKLFNIQVKYSVLTRIISVLSLILTLFLTKNLFWLIAVYFISNAFLNYFFYLVTQKKNQPNKKEDPQTLSYGKHLSLIGIISVIANYLDQVLVFILIGSTQLAIYAFAVILPNQIQSILKNVNVLALPKFATRSRKEIRVNIMQKFWRFFFLTGVIIIIYIIIAPYIYQIIFPKYLASIPYSQLFIFSLISSPAVLMGTSFQAKIMKKELYLLKLVPLIRIILLVLLTHFYGILGTIVAMVGAKVFGLILILFLFRKF